MIFLNYQSDYVPFKALRWLLSDFKMKARLCHAVSELFRLSLASSLIILLLILGTCQIRFDFILPGTLNGWWLRELGVL